MNDPPDRRSAIQLAARFAAGVAAAALAPGCRPGTPAPSAGTAPAADPRPFAGRAVRVNCADAELGKSLVARAGGWSGRTGAAVALVGDPAGADALVVPTRELAALAPKLRPTPVEFRAAANPLQRGAILEAYRDDLPRWGPNTVALPVRADGFVLVTRTDRLSDPKLVTAMRAKFGRAPDVPRSYEDLAELAEVAAGALGQPPLAPVPSSPARLLAEFSLVAACYDRAALVTRAKDAGTDYSALSFFVSAETGAPRLDSPGFAAAAALLARLAPHRAPGGDAIEALKTSAVAAVLSLAELARLPRDPGGAAEAVYRIDRLPGTRAVSAGRTLAPTAGLPNFVPVFGLDAHFYAVPLSNESPEAAWDLGADLAGSASSGSTLSDPTSGSGPFRREHLEPRSDALWLRYRLNAEQSGRLAEALRANAAPNTLNFALPFRAPNQAEYEADLERVLRPLALGKLGAAEAMGRAQAEWKARDARTPSTGEDRRRALGL